MDASNSHECDVSHKATGYYLEQVDTFGHKRPVAFSEESSTKQNATTLALGKNA